MTKRDEDKDDTVTLSRAELDELLSRRERDAKMDPQERKVRGIVREELAAALSEFFTPADDEDEDEDAEGKRRQSIGGGNVLGFLTG